MNIWLLHEETGPKATVEIYLMGRNTRKLLLKEQLLHPNGGWENKPITNLADWLVTDHRGRLSVMLTLQIVCKDCKVSLDDTSLPMLEIGEEVKLLQRKRRSVSCSQQMEGCCREPLFLQFKDLDDPVKESIMYPKGIDIGYCRGRCGEHTAGVGHGAVLRLAKKKNSSNFQQCCVPHKYEPFKIFMHQYSHANNDTMLMLKDIEGIKVTECACH